MVAFAQERRSRKSVPGPFYVHRTNQANWLTFEIGGQRVGLSPSRVYDVDLGCFLQRDPLSSIAAVARAVDTEGLGIWANTEFARMIVDYANQMYSVDPRGLAQRGPAGFAAALNSYLYASGAPLSLVDPTGLFGWDRVAILLATFVAMSLCLDCYLDMEANCGKPNSSCKCTQTETIVKCAIGVATFLASVYYVKAARLFPKKWSFQAATIGMLLTGAGGLSLAKRYETCCCRPKKAAPPPPPPPPPPKLGTKNVRWLPGDRPPPPDWDKIPEVEKREVMRKEGYTDEQIDRISRRMNGED